MKNQEEKEIQERIKLTYVREAKANKHHNNYK
jgi:hypothetical protein